MILGALSDLAKREGLLADPDYESRRVAWIVVLDRNGTLLHINGTHQERPRREGRTGTIDIKSFDVPRQLARTSGVRAQFLVDNALYVFGRAAASAGIDGPSPDRKSAAFLELIRKCADTTRDDGAIAVVRFLEDVQAGIRTELPRDPPIRPNDLFAFALESPVELIHERQVIRDYWREIRSSLSVANSGPGAPLQCLVTGAPVDVSGVIDKVKRVPGTNPAGAALVSFNQAAFESYGWSRNENAPISRAAGEAATTALNRLLTRGHPDSRHPGEKLGNRFVRLGGDTIVVFWSGSSHSDAAMDSLAAIFSDSPDDVEGVGELYRSIWTGRVPNIRDPSAFYALTLSGAQGRIMIRGWIESTVDQVVGNLARHFHDLDIVRHARGRGGGELPLPSLRTLAESIGMRSASRQGDVPEALTAEFARAALSGTPYPLGLLQRAILRTRAEACRDEWIDVRRRDSRAALVKAVLGRTFHLEVSRDMNPSNPSPGYRLGRLMAVIERMQQAALGDTLNATVVDRYFSGASATPAVVFPRLLKNMRNHARKAKDEGSTSGLARWLEGEADSVMTGITAFPAYLSLEEQGQFVLGYHQERYWLWRSKEERHAMLTAQQPDDGVGDEAGAGQRARYAHQ